MKKTIKMMLVVLMALCCMQGCTKEKETSTAIKIGGTSPLTGGAAIYGNAVKRGAEIAVAEINALGGLQFDLKFEDDVHDEEKAENAYNALKDWGIQVSLASVTSGPCKLTAAMHHEDKIFGLTPSASSADVLVNGAGTVFQMCFNDPNQGEQSANYIYNKNLGTKIAVIYQSDIVYSKGIYETFAKQAEQLKLNVVCVQSFTTESSKDFTVQLTEAKNAGADLLFLPIYYQEASIILTKANEMGYKPIFFGVDGMDGILTQDGFDAKLAEDVILLTPFNADSTDEKTVKFVAKYQELYGEVPNQFAADAYDCVYAIYQACNAGKVTYDMTAEEICDILIAQFTTMTFDGITGTGATWKTDGSVNKTPKGMIIKNGAYVGLD